MSGSDIQVKGETKLPETMPADTEGKQANESNNEAQSACSSAPATRSGSDMQVKGQTPIVPQPKTGQTSTTAGKNNYTEKAPAGEESR